MKTLCLFAFPLLLLCNFSLSIHAHPSKNQKAALIDSSSLLVQTKQGKLRGTTDNKVFVWRGIPYAKAPVGQFRLRAPQPAESWQGIRQAVAFGPVCPQMKSSFTNDGEQNEDCLYLNIWSPAADGKKRPVMFWIHGGGFVVGSGSTELYNGSNLSANGDVVVVTINYRLGTLGFLYFDSLQRTQTGFDNNLGIRDQIAALKWVKENIAEFGGDPGNITIFGESAGGTSVETLMACGAAKGLFKGAIAESGPAAILWQPATAKSVTDRFLNELRISSDSIHLLKTLPIDSLKAAEERVMDYMIKKTPNKVFSPTIDGKFITTDIFACLSPEQSGNVALMIGTNKDESSIFASRKLGMAPRNAKGLEKEFFHVLDKEEKAKVLAAYSDYPGKRAVLDLITDAIFRIPAIRLAECQSIHSPVYMYQFNWSSFLLNVAGLRSFHGLEIPFVFGNGDGKRGRLLRVIASRSLIKRLSGQMQQAWINFARYGNPNGMYGGEWRSFDTHERATMIFDKKSTVILDPDKQRREAWEGVSYY